MEAVPEVTFTVPLALVVQVLFLKSRIVPLWTTNPPTLKVGVESNAGEVVGDDKANVKISME